MADELKDLLKEAYRDMDPATGMFPADWTCRRCGKVLNADGGHPAELYAGTYTGLCYECERAPYFVSARSPLDDALHVSWPPDCPAWRRDRREFVAYQGCETCNGTGVQGTRYSNWSRFREYCRPCLERYSSHPVREHLRWAQEAVTQAATARLRRRLEAMAREAAGLKGRVSKKRMEEAILTLPLDQVEQVRAAARADWKRVITRVDNLRRKFGADFVKEVKA